MGTWSHKCKGETNWCTNLEKEVTLVEVPAPMKWKVASGTDLENMSIGWPHCEDEIIQNGQWPFMGGNRGALEWVV